MKWYRATFTDDNIHFETTEIEAASEEEATDLAVDYFIDVGYTNGGRVEIEYLYDALPQEEINTMNFYANDLTGDFDL